MKHLGQDHIVLCICVSPHAREDGKGQENDCCFQLSACSLAKYFTNQNFLARCSIKEIMNLSPMGSLAEFRNSVATEQVYKVHVFYK